VNKRALEKNQHCRADSSAMPAANGTGFPEWGSRMTGALTPLLG